MKLRVNGDPMETAASTVRDLVHQLGLAGKPAVVEVNQRALFPREHETTPLAEGDIIEIVQITAGG
jgi:thiamine biosynthesis protein ThiS